MLSSTQIILSKGKKKKTLIHITFFLDKSTHFLNISSYAKLYYINFITKYRKLCNRKGKVDTFKITLTLISIVSALVIQPLHARQSFNVTATFFIALSPTLFDRFLARIWTSTSDSFDWSGKMHAWNHILQLISKFLLTNSLKI